MRVPFLDLPAHHRAIRDEVRTALDAVIDSCGFILGPAVEDFERRFAAYLGVRHCIGVNNGTSALHLALLACGIGPGDEVITTPHTWISTTWAISYVGARPVFVDIDPVTYTLDPSLVERRITSRTKTLLPVHLYGQAADLTALASVAERHNLTLIEDAAQAHGARWQGRRVGSFGRAACFSFYPGKNLGAFGEGGAVATNDDQIAERVRRLRDHGQQTRHQHVDLGYNMRLEGLQGAVLSVKLNHLDRWNADRVRHARRYRELLAGTPHLVLPAEGAEGSHVWHLFVVLLRGVGREDIRTRLAAAGIATAIHYPTLVPFQPIYAGLGYGPNDFPIAQSVAASCLSLPMFPELTDEQINHVATSLRNCLMSRTVSSDVRAA